MSGYRDYFLLAYTEKFQCFTINPRNIDSDKQTEALQIEDQIIANTSQIKLLGVEIDDKSKHPRVIFILNRETYISASILKCNVETKMGTAVAPFVVTMSRQGL